MWELHWHRIQLTMKIRWNNAILRRKFCIIQSFTIKHTFHLSHEYNLCSHNIHRHSAVINDCQLAYDKFYKHSSWNVTAQVHTVLNMRPKRGEKAIEESNIVLTSIIKPMARQQKQHFTFIRLLSSSSHRTLINKQFKNKYSSGKGLRIYQSTQTNTTRSLSLWLCFTVWETCFHQTKQMFSFRVKNSCIFSFRSSFPPCFVPSRRIHFVYVLYMYTITHNHSYSHSHSLTGQRIANRNWYYYLAIEMRWKQNCMWRNNTQFTFRASVCCCIARANERKKKILNILFQFRCATVGPAILFAPHLLPILSHSTQ